MDASGAGPLAPIAIDQGSTRSNCRSLVASMTRRGILWLWNLTVWRALRISPWLKRRPQVLYPETPHGFPSHCLASPGWPIRCVPRFPMLPVIVGQRIRAVMLTGDHRVTARAIARQAGLEGDPVLDGSSIERMEEAELAEAMKRVSVANRRFQSRR